MTKVSLKKTNFGIPLPIKYIPTIPTTMQVNKNPIILLRRCARLWPASDIMYHMLSFRFRLLLDFLLHFFTPKKCFFSRKNITAFASSTFSLYSILKDECFLAGHSLKMNQPEFLTPLRNHTVEVGKNVTFECYVTGIEKYKVSNYTMFENYSKYLIWIFEFWHFPPILVKYLSGNTVWP